MVAALVILTLLLAAANGANDVSKGIATLVGAKMASPQGAVIWGVAATAAGGLVAAFATQDLVRTFSGQGVLGAEGFTPSFFLSVAIGAVAWLVMATWTGLPVSTTHSLFGALVGAAIARDGIGGVVWGVAATKIMLPLLVSPLASLIFVVVVYPVVERAFKRVNRYCVCIEGTAVELPDPNGAMMMSGVGTSEAVIVADDCGDSSARINVMDSLHWLSAGATSFFRGMNDTPKILAIGVAATATGAISTGGLYVLVVAAMAAGGLYAGLKVVHTLADKVTPLDHEGGLAANGVTSILVGLASRFALPVSTTHVSTGAIVGIGASQGGRNVRWNVLGGILLAWVVTLPLSGVCAAGAFALTAKHTFLG